MTTKTASTQTRFSQLSDGTWGISALPGELSTGERIRVRKANGEYRECTVGAVDHVDRGAWNLNAPNGREYRRLAGRQAPAQRLPGTDGVTAATDKQVRYIESLGGKVEPGLTKRAASEYIDRLKQAGAGAVCTDARRTDPLTGRPFVCRELEDKQDRIDAEEIRSGEGATRLAQQAGPAGSEAREAAYLAQELNDYNMGL